MSWLADIAGKAEALLDQVDAAAATGLNNRHVNNIATATATAKVATTAAVVAATHETDRFSDISSNVDIMNIFQDDSLATTTITATTTPSVTVNSEEPANSGDSIERIEECLRLQQQQQQEQDPSVRDMNSENVLLRRELISLQDEISMYVKRLHVSTVDLDTAQQNLIETRSRATERDVELKQAYEEISKLRDELVEVQSRIGILHQEKQDALNDHANSSDVHSQALDTLRMRLKEEEAARNTYECTTSTELDTVKKRLADVELNSVELSVELADAHALTVELTNEVCRLKEARDLADGELLSQRRELTEYKARATRVLQNKEQVIRDLKSNGNATNIEGEDNDMMSNAAVVAATAEVLKLRQQCESRGDEITQCCVEIDKLRGELADISEQAESDAHIATSRISDLESALAEENHRCQAALDDLGHQLIDMRRQRDEILAEKTVLSSRIQAVETDHEKLLFEVATKSFNNQSAGDLETRVRTLTENLLLKQEELEALRAAKTSLVLQVETEQQAASRARALAAQSQLTTKRLSGNGGLSGEDIDVEAAAAENTSVRYHPIASLVSIEDNNVSFVGANTTSIGGRSKMRKRVRQAANVLDVCSIRMGVFLRRYPIARIFFLGYTLSMHIWVVVILLTYSPEMHASHEESMLIV